MNSYKRLKEVDACDGRGHTVRRHEFGGVEVQPGGNVLKTKSLETLAHFEAFSSPRAQESVPAAGVALGFFGLVARSGFGLGRAAKG